MRNRQIQSLFGLTPKQYLKAEKEYWKFKQNFDVVFPQYRSLHLLNIKTLSPSFHQVLLHTGLKLPEKMQSNIFKWVKASYRDRNSFQRTRHYNSALRFCPLCWNDQSKQFFPIQWNYTFAHVCLEHGVPLQEKCPDCNQIYVPKNEFKNFQANWLTTCRHCDYSFLNQTAQQNKTHARLQQRILTTILSNPQLANPSTFRLFIRSSIVLLNTFDDLSIDELLESQLRILNGTITKINHLICGKCGKPCGTNISPLSNHIKACGKALKCLKHPNIIFNTDNHFKDHNRACGKNLTCSNHNQKYPYIFFSAYESHMKACNKNLKCQNHPLQTFTSFIGYESHLKACRQDLTCSNHVKKRIFGSYSGYDKHIKACNKNLKCPNHSDRRFTSISGYENHIKVCGKKNLCSNHPNNHYTSYRGLKDHLKACGKNLKCKNHPDRNFTTYRGYDFHIKACGKNLKCPKHMNRDFISYRGYKNHMKACGLVPL